MDVVLLVCLLVFALLSSGWAVGGAITTFLALGGVGFWVFLAAVSVAILVALEYDHEPTAFLSLALLGVVLQMYCKVNVLGFFLAHWWVVIPAYFIVGTGWSLFKWFLYVRDQYKYWKQQCAGRESEKPEVPQAADHKSRILGWMTFWPWSLVWFIINDPVRRAFRAIFEHLQGTYQRIADKAFRDI